MSSLAAIPVSLSPYRDQAQKYIQRSKAENTVRAYQADWRDFSAFCQREKHVNLPASPETVALYLTWLIDVQKRKTATLTRRLAAISQAHQTTGLPTPTQDLTVRAVLAGIRRTHGSQTIAKSPLVPVLLKRLLDQIPDTPIGQRNRALLLLGFAGGLRRSELVAIEYRDLESTSSGLLITIRHSKGDPEGRGQTIGIPFGRHPQTCPVRALRTWLDIAGIDTGPVFRSTAPWTGQILPRALEAKRVATLIQQLAGQAGLDPTQFGGHSLRSGLATAAAAGGASERAIMDQTRHKSVLQVRRYIRRGSAFQDNAASFTDL